MATVKRNRIVAYRVLAPQLTRIIRELMLGPASLTIKMEFGQVQRSIRHLVLDGGDKPLTDPVLGGVLNSMRTRGDKSSAGQQTCSFQEGRVYSHPTVTGATGGGGS